MNVKKQKKKKDLIFKYVERMRFTCFCQPEINTSNKVPLIYILMYSKYLVAHTAIAFLSDVYIISFIHIFMYYLY